MCLQFGSEIEVHASGGVEFPDKAGGEVHVWEIRAVGVEHSRECLGEGDGGGREQGILWACFKKGWLIFQQILMFFFIIYMPFDDSQ